ncbi:two-component system chemotaxis response regulator CheY [Runella defluvii]|uniref:Two-component system chemotaxis response regulator CheY n=1 Tax=Runella defluvii TaxID=370973 RepID=A0A7W6ETG7_9BACT|nr:response regulator [Runella defluvii]MBB3841577.1 two-component system chemotaxis response regulator CheY [Runella defluvii]
MVQIGVIDVEEASDAISALQRLRESKYNLVISDENMEPMTGLQLLKEIRNDSELQGTLFIMVTAESSTGNVIAAKEVGVGNYLVKPFNAETLKKKIESLCGSM